MTVILDRLNDLPDIHLAKGSHATFADGACVMEVAAWLAGEPHSDNPSCVSPVLRAFTIGLNDAWSDEQRQALAPFVPRLVGTAGDGHDEARSLLALDWLIRTYTPAWLDLSGLSDDAQALRDLPPIEDIAAARAAGPVVRAAREKAAAAWDAAGAAAWAAAGAAARDAAWAAAAAAARAAAGAAARDAAWAAAGAAARDAAWDAAGAAARDAAWDAAAAAAWAAARAALRPTVEGLQASALELLDAMLTIGEAA